MVHSTEFQYPLPETLPKNPFDSRVEGAFGEFVGDINSEAKLAFIKELTNKLSWVIGSSYKKRYSGKRGPVNDYAARMVKRILKDHGYQI